MEAEVEMDRGSQLAADGGRVGTGVKANSSSTGLDAESGWGEWKWELVSGSG